MAFLPIRMHIFEFFFDLHHGLVQHFFAGRGRQWWHQQTPVVVSW
jgi:hypothetical protein